MGLSPRFSFLKLLSNMTYLLAWLLSEYLWVLALVLDWMKWFGNSSSASTKICQNWHLFPRLLKGNRFDNVVGSVVKQQQNKNFGASFITLGGWNLKPKKMESMLKLQNTMVSHCQLFNPILQCRYFSCTKLNDHYLIYTVGPCRILCHVGQDKRLFQNC